MIGSTYLETDRMERAVALLAQLVGALELREESDPDSPPWAAEREIRRLESEIMKCLRTESWLDIGDDLGHGPRYAERRERGLANSPRRRAGRVRIALTAERSERTTDRSLSMSPTEDQIPSSSRPGRGPASHLGSS